MPTRLRQGNLTALLRLDLNRATAKCSVRCRVVYSPIVKQLSRRYLGLTIALTQPLTRREP